MSHRRLAESQALRGRNEPWRGSIARAPMRMLSDQSVRALLNRSSPPLEVVRFPKRFLTDPRVGCHAAAVVFSFPLGASTSRCTGPEPAGTTEESSSAPGGSPTRTQARRRMRRLPPAGDGLVPERNSLLSCARSSSHAAASEAAARVASRSDAAACAVRARRSSAPFPSAPDRT